MPARPAFDPKPPETAKATQHDFSELLSSGSLGGAEVYAVQQSGGSRGAAIGTALAKVIRRLRTRLTLHVTFFCVRLSREDSGRARF